MGDLSFKPIGDVRVGDEVIGWEHPDTPKIKGAYARRRYVKAVVVAVGRRLAPVVEVTLASGRVLRCTPDHLWANGNPDYHEYQFVRRRQYGTGKYSRQWTTAHIKATLRRSIDPVSVTDLSPQQQRWALWLGGMFDGEGSCSGCGMSIAQSQSHNPDVHAAIGRALDLLGFDYRAHTRGYYIRGGLQTLVKFLVWCRPVRRAGLERAVLGCVFTAADRVVQVRDIGIAEVVSLQTSTGNYVAWGYLSKNCNYAKIVAWDKIERAMQPNVAQEMVLALWGQLESRGLAISMQQLKARQLGVCLDPATLVLTADLRWIPLADVCIGQALVAVEEFPRGGQGAGRKMRVGWVEARTDVYEDAYELTFEDGRTLIATGPHRFLSRHRGGVHTQWRRVSDTVAGDHIRAICDKPWMTPTYEDGWFGGILDGEGSLRAKDRAGVELCAAQVFGAVYDRMRRYLTTRGYTVREDVDHRKAGTSSKFGNQPVAKVVLGRMSEIFRLVGQTRPSRFVSQPWWEGKELTGKRVGYGWVRIASVRVLGKRRMIDLQTSTQTFIANGFVSHNSTLTELAVAQRVQLHPNTNAVVASADPTKSVRMAKMIEFAWEHMPWWLMPTLTINNASTKAFGEINTSLLIQAGNQFTGIARGDTPSVFHGSEMCEWPDPETTLESALMRAMHETPDLFLVLESTALGRGNWWHKTWKISKSDWGEGRARLCPIFLPWFVGTDIYPTPTWLRARPVPANWVPEDKTILHAERARAYVLANPLLFQFLARGNHDWQMPREQMWFYEVERNNAIRKNTLNKFLQEMPADDSEAFQSSNVSAIGSEVILEYRERVPPPLGVYTIVGPHIPRELIVSRREWDFTKPPLYAKPQGLLNRYEDVYQFVPLVFRGYSDTDPALRLFIWELPAPSELYGVGVDTSDGVGLDNSVIQVHRKGSPTRLDRQVAEFASGYIKSNQLWPMTIALSMFYSPFQPHRQRRVQCRVAIECRGNGDIVQLEMKKRGWSNFHPWLHYDSRKRPAPDRAVKEGVYTNQAFRAQMMDVMLTMIDENTIEISSPWLVEEMEALERDETRQSLKAASGEHDDRFMALGFPVFSLHVLDIPGRQYSRKQQRSYMGGDPNEDTSPVVYATFPGHPGTRSQPMIDANIIPLERRRSQFGFTERLGLGRYKGYLPKGYTR